MGDSLPLLLKLLLLVKLVMRTEMLACLRTYLHYIGNPWASNQIYTPKYMGPFLDQGVPSDQTLNLVIKATIERLLTFVWLLDCSVDPSTTTISGGSGDTDLWFMIPSSK